jgi:hypothetical protein
MLKRRSTKRTTGREAIWFRRALSVLCLALLVSGFVHVPGAPDVSHGYSHSVVSAETVGAPSGDCHDEGDRAHGNTCSSPPGCSFAALTPDEGTGAALKASAATVPPRRAPNGVTSAPRIRPPKISGQA